MNLQLNELLEQDIFSLLGLTNISEEEKNNLIHKFNTTIQARVYRHLAELLSEEDFNQIDNLDAHALQEYLQTKEIDLPALVKEEAIRYRVELIAILDLTTKPSQGE